MQIPNCFPAFNSSWTLCLVLWASSWCLFFLSFLFLFLFLFLPPSLHPSLLPALPFFARQEGGWMSYRDCGSHTLFSSLSPRTSPWILANLPAWLSPDNSRQWIGACARRTSRKLANATRALSGWTSLHFCPGLIIFVYEKVSPSGSAIIRNQNLFSIFKKYSTYRDDLTGMWYILSIGLWKESRCIQNIIKIKKI